MIEVCNRTGKKSQTKPVLNSLIKCHLIKNWKSTYKELLMRSETTMKETPSERLKY